MPDMTRTLNRNTWIKTQSEIYIFDATEIDYLYFTETYSHTFQLKARLNTGITLILGTEASEVLIKIRMTDLIDWLKKPETVDSLLEYPYSP